MKPNPQISRPLCCLLLAPAGLLLVVLWLMNLAGIPDTPPGYTWSTQG